MAKTETVRRRLQRPPDTIPSDVPGRNGQKRPAWRNVKPAGSAGYEGAGR